MTDSDEVKLLPCPFCGIRMSGPEGGAYGHPIGSPDCILAYNAIDEHDFARWNTRPPVVTDEVVELLKRIYLAGHSEGWTGNQQRRDVQHVDAEKGWSLYVKNGALASMPAVVSGGQST